MATVVWHSCSDQQTAELLPPPPPLTALRLKLAPQKPADQLLAAWNFLITDDVTPPTTTTTDYATRERENDAFAPRTLSSSSPSVKVKLSDKSLEMCTENLGCETGSSDVISSDGDGSDTTPPNDDDCKSRITRNNSTRQQSVWGRKVNRNRGGRSSSCFPPPLTTMRSGVVVVRSRRSEEGRLVMDAVNCPYSSRSNFITHRSPGRLRLSLLRSDHHNKLDEEAQLIIKTTHTTTTLVDENQLPKISLDINIPEKNHHHHIIREEESVEEEEETESTAGKFQRLPTMSRCMEAGGEHDHRHHHHRHHHRKQFINVRLNWVATS